MTRNQLPEGVGKKIVEALKRQAEAEIADATARNEELIAAKQEPAEEQEDAKEQENTTAPENAGTSEVYESNGNYDDYNNSPEPEGDNNEDSKGETSENS
jgi:hypothetical protein